MFSVSNVSRRKVEEIYRQTTENMAITVNIMVKMITEFLITAKMTLL